jgi:hypothetical protein
MKPETLITPDDINDLAPVLKAARDAVRRSNWKIGDPVESLSSLIALVTIAHMSRMMSEAGIYDRLNEAGAKFEMDGGPDDCGFY